MFDFMQKKSYFIIILFCNVNWIPFHKSNIPGTVLCIERHPINYRSLVFFLNSLKLIFFFFFWALLIRDTQGSSKSAPDLFKQNPGHNPIINCYLKEKDFCLWRCHCFINTKTARGQHSCLSIISEMMSISQTPIFSLYRSSPMTS